MPVCGDEQDGESCVNCWSPRNRAAHQDLLWVPFRLTGAHCAGSPEEPQAELLEQAPAVLAQMYQDLHCVDEAEPSRASDGSRCRHMHNRPCSTAPGAEQHSRYIAHVINLYASPRCK